MSLREYDPSINESNPEVAYVDMATYGEVEKFMYGDRSYFVRETTRSSWFTQVPIKMNLDTSNPDFNQTFTAEVARTGDYLLNAWLRVTLNAVSIYTPGTGTYANSTGKGRETLVWSCNFMHHLVENCKMKVNGMVIDELYSEHLDFLTAFTIPKGSRAGYNRMIGNFTSPYNGLAGINVCGVKARTNKNLNAAQDLFLPLPFFFSKNSGLALPIAALPYGNVKFEFKLRDWRKLLTSMYIGYKYENVDIRQLLNQTPKLSNVQVWGNYSIVSKSERSKMGCRPRDMLIEQNQQLNGALGSKFLNGQSLNATTSVDLKLNGAVKALFFAVKDMMGTIDNPYRGSYATGPNVSDVMTIRLSTSGTSISGTCINSSNASGEPPTNINLNWYSVESNDYSGFYWDERDNVDPVGTATILYENTPRIKMEGNYYSLIQPYYHAKNIPESGSSRNVIVHRNPNEIGGMAQLSLGYHMYSYALDINKIDPCGSVNYGKLTNASLVITPTKSTVNAIVNKFGPFRLFISAINHNVLRVSGGTLGFPVV